MPTREQLIENIKAMEAQGAPQEDIQAYLDSFKPVETPPKPKGNLLDVGIGVGKGAIQTLQNVSTPITSLLERTSGRSLGFSDQQLAPTNLAQSIGKGVERIAEFAVPGTAGLRVAKASGLLNLGARVGTEAIGAGGVTLAQTKDLNQAKTGALIGGAFPAIGSTLGSIKSTENAARLINSLVKPKKPELSYGKNPGRAVAEEGIVGASLEDLAGKISARKNEIGQVIDTLISGSKKPIDAFDAFKPLDQAIKEASKAKRTNAGLITRLEDLKADLTQGKVLDNISPSEAFQIKKDVQSLTKYTGNDSDDKLVNSTLQSVYRNLRKKIDTAVGDPNIKKLNEKYGDLISAEKAIADRILTSERQNLLSLPGIGVGGASGLVTSLLTDGAVTPTILVGLGSVAARKVLSSPGVKTRVAAWLAGRTPKERAEIFKVAPYLKGLIMTSLGD